MDWFFVRREFRRLRAASYFALGGKVTKTPPGNGSGWTLRFHIRLIPGPHYGGRVPESQQRISGAQNLSGCSKFLPGHWALAVLKLRLVRFHFRA